MNKVELYREILHLTPYNGGNKEDYRKTLKEALNKYNIYKGLPSKAGSLLSNMLRENQNSILYKTLPVNSALYRMRTFEDRRTNISHMEMFHIPTEMRRKVSTQRYSTPGYPCLYLGMSVYTCWEELGLNEQKQQEENYRNSAFGHLEGWLGAEGFRIL